MSTLEHSVLSVPRVPLATVSVRTDGEWAARQCAGPSRVRWLGAAEGTKQYSAAYRLFGVGYSAVHGAVHGRYCRGYCASRKASSRVSAPKERPPAITSSGGRAQSRCNYGRGEPVSAQMWQGSAPSRCNYGRGRPRLGAIMAGVSPVPAQMWQGLMFGAGGRQGRHGFGKRMWRPLSGPGRQR